MDLEIKLTDSEGLPVPEHRIIRCPACKQPAGLKLGPNDDPTTRIDFLKVERDGKALHVYNLNEMRAPAALRVGDGSFSSSSMLLNCIACGLTFEAFGGHA